MGEMQDISVHVCCLYIFLLQL